MLTTTESRIEWTDTDEGDNPVFSTSSLPSWLSISNDGQMSTNAPVTTDVGPHSFTLKLSDKHIHGEELGIDETIDVDIVVGQNSPPVFTNIEDIPQLITVGCYDQNQTIFDINWYDPDNNLPHFNGNDVITFSVTEDVPWMNIDETGKIFCVTAPKTTTLQHQPLQYPLLITAILSRLLMKKISILRLLLMSHRLLPILTNLASSMSINDESYTLDIDHSDLDENQVTYQLRVDTYLSTQLSWVSLDPTTGMLVINPTQNNIGSHELVFTISDGCLSTDEEKSFTILGN